MLKIFWVTFLTKNLINKALNFVYIVFCKISDVYKKLTQLSVQYYYNKCTTPCKRHQGNNKTKTI